MTHNALCIYICLLDLPPTMICCCCEEVGRKKGAAADDDTHPAARREERGRLPRRFELRRLAVMEARCIPRRLRGAPELAEDHPSEERRALRGGDKRSGGAGAEAAEY